MPDQSLTPDKRTRHPEQTFAINAPAPFIELGFASCFSFLHGASDAVDLATTAWRMGDHAIGIVDRNSVAS